MAFPKKYIGTLPKKKREAQLLKRIRTGSFEPDGYKSKRKSRWTLMFHKKFPGVSIKDLLKSKTLKTVYDRGRRAWQTSGSRPGVTADQWGTARVYKFILVSLGAKSTRYDPDEDLRR